MCASKQSAECAEHAHQPPAPLPETSDPSLPLPDKPTELAQPAHRSALYAMESPTTAPRRRVLSGAQLGQQLRPVASGGARTDDRSNHMFTVRSAPGAWQSEVCSVLGASGPSDRAGAGWDTPAEDGSHTLGEPPSPLCEHSERGHHRG
jgi:hypothetical protein